MLCIIDTLYNSFVISKAVTIEFSLNVFTEFAGFNDTKIYLKRLSVLPTSYVRDLDATIAPVRQR